MNRKRLSTFLTITFAITGAAWVTLAFLTQTNVISFGHPLGTILHLIGGFGPTAAALAVQEEKVTFQAAFRLVFLHKRNSLIHLLVLSLMTIAGIGISSQELNSQIPWYFIPIIFLQAVFLYGGEEELGWRGIMQPLLERKLPFPVATVITGLVWGIWHIPLWFVKGSSQQNIAFSLFLILGVILSFFLAALYKKTHCVFSCSVFHGLVNTLLSVFVIKLNPALIVGLGLILAYSVFLWYHEDKKSSSLMLTPHKAVI